METRIAEKIHLVEPSLPQFAIMDRHTKQAALVNLTAIYLSRLINLPIRRINYREHYGRIVIVSYEPYGYSDPVLPIPLADLGPVFFGRFSGFAHHVLAWPGNERVELRRWTVKAHELINQVSDSLKNENLTRNEYQYFLFHLALTVARPVQ